MHIRTTGGNQKKVGVCMCAGACACTLHFNCFTFQSLYPFRPPKMGLSPGACVRVSFKREKYISKMISMKVWLGCYLREQYGCVNWRCCKSIERAEFCINCHGHSTNFKPNSMSIHVPLIRMTNCKPKKNYTHWCMRVRERDITFLGIFSWFPPHSLSDITISLFAFYVRFIQSFGNAIVVLCVFLSLFPSCSFRIRFIAYTISLCFSFTGLDRVSWLVCVLPMRRNQCTVVVMYTMHGTHIDLCVGEIDLWWIVRQWNVILVAGVVGLSIHLLGHILQSISHDVTFISQFSKKYRPSINNNDNDNDNKRNQAESKTSNRIWAISQQDAHHITYTLSIKLHNVSLSADALSLRFTFCIFSRVSACISCFSHSMCSLVKFEYISTWPNEPKLLIHEHCRAVCVFLRGCVRTCVSVCAFLDSWFVSCSCSFICLKDSRMLRMNVSESFDCCMEQSIWCKIQSNAFDDSFVFVFIFICFSYFVSAYNMCECCVLCIRSSFSIAHFARAGQNNNLYRLNERTCMHTLSLTTHTHSIRFSRINLYL